MAEMQAAGTFLDAGRDLAAVAAGGPGHLWRTNEGGDHPRLWWEREAK
jgi:hypothetical protein